MTQPAQSIIIRPVKVEDAERIWEISRQPGVMETIMTAPGDRLDQRLKQLAELTLDEHYFVAEVDGKVAGLAGLTVGTGRTRHSGYVFLFIARENQGQGLGSRLLQTLLDLADNWLLLQRVELTVIVGNEKAKQLYEKHGFKVEGRRRWSIIAEGELKDEWMMARCK